MRHSHPRGISTVVLAALCLTSMVACGGASGNRGDGRCDSDADCSGELARCASGRCVECVRDDHCGCHEICDDNVCVPFGAETADTAQNAHGLWSGEPGTTGYRHSGFCQSEADCQTGDICNPFTAGCVSPTDFTIGCSTVQCPGGLACAPGINLCLPTALCRTDNNCCGSEEQLLCDESVGLCRPLASECTPPTAIESVCPFAPRLVVDCDGGFCSPLGECVGCTCDADCSAGFKCYQPTRTCQPRDFCLTASDCGLDESCDRAFEVCAPRCDPDPECSAPAVCCGDSELCDPVDLVCRSLSDLPCTADAAEPNEAAAGARVLTLPPLGAPATTSAFSLCEGDVDWYALPLVIGDELTISVSSVNGLNADLVVVAPDEVTEVTRGRLTDFGAPPQLVFTANRTLDYFLRVEPVLGGTSTGLYSLTVSRKAGVACVDELEEDNGFNDTAATATVLLDPDAPGVPVGCSPGGTTQSPLVSCSGTDLCAGDTDFYLVHVPNGSQLDVKISGFGQPEDLDLILFGPFADASSATTDVEAMRSASGDVPERLRLIARPEQWYLVQVVRTRGTSTTYTLEASITAPTVPCDEDDYDADPSGDGEGLSPQVLIDDPPFTNDLATDATAVALLGGEQNVFVTTAGTPLTLCRGDVDWFRLGVEGASSDVIPLPADHRVEVELLVEPGSPPGITLAAGPDASTLVWGSTDPGDPVSRVDIPLTEADTDYTVAVIDSPSNPRHVDYTLRLRLVEPDPCNTDRLGDVPPVNNNVGMAARNDAPSGATQLNLASDDWPTAVDWPLGGSYLYQPSAEGDLTLCAHDDDWYVIDVPIDAEVRAWIAYDPTEADVGLALYSSSVATVTSPTGGVPPTNGLLDLSAVDGRGYQRVAGTAATSAYIMVYNRTGWPLLEYDLGIQLMPRDCEPDQYEEDDLPETATHLRPDPLSYSEQTDWIVLDPLTACSDGGGEEYDWFALPMTPGDVLTSRVFFDAGQGGLELVLSSPGGADLPPVATATTGVGVLELVHEVAAGAPGGDYLLRVDPSPGADNRYYLEVSVERACIDDAYEPFPPERIATLSYTSSPLAVSGAVLCNDDDWYFVDGIGSGQQVTVCIDFLHAEGDIDAAAWATVSLVDDVPTGDGSPLVVSQTKADGERLYLDSAPGPFYVHVSLDPRDALTPTYGLRVIDGDSTCD